ncbi:MAG: hypothetical protein DMG81_10600 [Acidobacteria bacterium]|nr:MAG: hypothetical protein DMG81_10600 [Acidobacteriota bacterium]
MRTEKGNIMELRDSAAAAKRFIHGLLSGRGPKRYVVEVDGICAEAFDIPGTEICEYWENADLGYVHC